jgi:predicted kinase
MARLAIMCGLPKAGKSTQVKSLKLFGWVRVCPDDVRLALHGHQFIPEAEEFVWATTKIMAKALLRSGHSVVIDATNTTKERRKPWVNLAKETGGPLLIYTLDTSLGVCLKRNEILEVGKLDPAIIDRMAEQYEAPTEDEGKIILLTSVLNAPENKEEIGTLTAVPSVSASTHEGQMKY